MKQFLKKIPLMVFLGLFLFSLSFSPNDSGSNLKADTLTDDPTLADWCWGQCLDYAFDATRYWLDMTGVPHEDENSPYFLYLLEENFNRCAPHCTYVGWYHAPAPAYG